MTCLLENFFSNSRTNFFLNLSPSSNLRSRDRDNNSISSTNVKFFGGNHVKLHQLFLHGGISIVLDVKNGLSALAFDGGGLGSGPFDHFLVDGNDHFDWIFVSFFWFFIKICKFDLRL